MNVTALCPERSARPGLPALALERIEVHRIDVITHGVRSEFCVDLTRVACTSTWCGENDMAWCMEILTPLRDWLEIHGVFTPGSGMLVRVLPADIHPDDLAEELTRPGEAVATCRLTTTIQPGATTHPRGAALPKPHLTVCG